MALKVGANEAERYRIISLLKAGKSFADATATLRGEVEQDWFDRNEKHLMDVAKTGEPKVSVADAASAVPTKTK